MVSLATYLKNITQAEYHKVDKKLEKYNLVKGQATLLVTIRENDGSTQNELADIFNIKASSMSERLNKLEILGYITRSIDENNLKFKRVFITTNGKKAATQCNRILNEFEESLYNGFNKKEVKQLEDYLNRITDNIEKM